jgi:signal transduction histidine kinase
MVTAGIAIVPVSGAGIQMDEPALRRLVSAMGLLGDAIVATDAQGAVVLLNDAAEALLRAGSGDLVGALIETALPLVDAATREPIVHPVRRVLAGESAALAGPALLQIGGVEAPAGEIAATPGDFVALGDGGVVCGALVIIRDGALQIAAELRRQESQRRLEEERQTDRMRVLAGGIAHDLNNLLTVIAGNVELARFDLRDTAVAAECLDQIAAASRRAANLTQQLLTYAGRARMVLIPIDLNTLIGGVAQQFADTTGARISLRMQLSADLPQVAADSAQLQQALMNILTNAVEAIGEAHGTITIKTELRQMGGADLRSLILGGDLAEGAYVALSITDSGDGMDSLTRARIFEPFFTTKFIGRGLGLATVLGIVKEHGGCLDVESAVDRGTTLMILLPALIPAGDPPLSHSEAPQPSQSALGRVLVVDDEESVRTVTARMLRRLDYDVVHAADGAVAIELFREQHEQLAGVLLDLTMPGMSGAEIVAALTGINARVPLIIMSGYDKHEVAAQLGPDRALHFLAKPFTFDTLHDAVQQALVPPAL